MHSLRGTDVCGENGHILWKTHRIGNIASKRGKKQHDYIVYRVIFLKQMADHSSFLRGIRYCKTFSFVNKEIVVVVVVFVVVKQAPVAWKVANELKKVSTGSPK